MIELLYSEGNIFVYNANDWLELRKKHRIVGDLVGTLNYIPVLPLQLRTEEVLLLLEKNVAVVRKINTERQPKAKEMQEEFENALLESEMREYKKNRLIQLEGMKESLIEKRRRKGDARSDDEILREELDKSVIIKKENMIWPIQLIPNMENNRNEEIVTFEQILQRTTLLKWLIYKDLWEKGYYITCGARFGSDFLVYLGDPMLFHAIFIVRCVESEEPIFGNEIISFGRLGGSVRKRSVLASIKNGEISYISLNWLN